jgi:opacity protein-like surface antigen
MLNKIVCLVALATLVSVAPAAAQDQRVEVGVLLGWAFSDGVDGDPVATGDGNVYDRIDPKDSFKWGFNAGVLATENVEVGFLFGQQLTKLLASGTDEREVGDLTVNTYHGYFAYNFGFADLPARPYVMFGMGATSYSDVDFTRVITGQADTIKGGTQFSTTWGGGVKIYPSPNVGVRLGIQWTPTYIKSDTEGWWCDPWWGCYLVGDAQYANSWDLGGGISFRF